MILCFVSNLNPYLSGLIIVHFFRGVPPSPRSDHTAACHAERYLLIFGGGSHATVFNDLHVLDLQTVRVLEQSL